MHDVASQRSSRAVLLNEPVELDDIDEMPLETFVGELPEQLDESTAL